MHLYETHLPVANTETAKEFYTTIVGLPFAYRDPTRDIVFLWAVSREQGMVGLWGPGTAYGPANNSQFKHHLAFAVTLPELFRINENLRNNGVETVGFWGGKPANRVLSDGCRRHKFTFEIPTGTRWSSSAFCPSRRILASLEAIHNGKRGAPARHKSDARNVLYTKRKDVRGQNGAPAPSKPARLETYQDDLRRRDR